MSSNDGRIVSIADAREQREAEGRDVVRREELLAFAETIVERIKSGEVTGFAYVTCTEDSFGAAFSWTSDVDGNSARMMAGVGLLAHRINRCIDDQI